MIEFLKKLSLIIRQQCTENDITVLGIRSEYSISVIDSDVDPHHSAGSFCISLRFIKSQRRAPVHRNIDQIKNALETQMQDVNYFNTRYTVYNSYWYDINAFCARQKGQQISTVLFTFSIPEDRNTFLADILRVYDIIYVLSGKWRTNYAVLWEDEAQLTKNYEAYRLEKIINPNIGHTSKFFLREQMTSAFDDE